MSSAWDFSFLTSCLIVLASRYVSAISQLVQQQYFADFAAMQLPVPPMFSEYTASLPESGIRSYDSSSSCKLLSGFPYYLNEGFDCNPLNATLPSTGTLRTTMIFVDFDDAQASENTTDLYQHFMPAAGDWYRKSSFGRLNLDVTADFSRFYRMPHNSSTYNYTRSMGGLGHRRYIQDVLDVVGSNVSFAGTSLLYIVPTKEAYEISYSPTFMNPIKSADGTTINKTVSFGHDMYYFGFKLMNHETGHTMGLPDTYSYEPRTPATIFVGGYDLMAQIEGVSPDYLAWHKWRLGWIEDDQVLCLNFNVWKPQVERYTLTPIEEAAGLKAIVFKIDAPFAIVAEARSGKGLNSDVCGTGILIYTVYPMVPTGRGPIQVQDSSPNSQGCAGAKLNDALFVPNSHDRKTFTRFGVNITVIEKTEQGFVVEVHQY